MTIHLPKGVAISRGDVLRPGAFETEFGMAWFPAGSTSIITVERIYTFDGVAVLSVNSRWEDSKNVGRKLEIAVSKGGQSIRCWLDEARLVKEGR